MTDTVPLRSGAPEWSASSPRPTSSPTRSGGSSSTTRCRRSSPARTSCSSAARRSPMPRAREPARRAPLAARLEVGPLLARRARWPGRSPNHHSRPIRYQLRVALQLGQHGQHARSPCAGPSARWRAGSRGAPAGRTRSAGRTPRRSRPSPGAESIVTSRSSMYQPPIARTCCISCSASTFFGSRRKPRSWSATRSRSGSSSNTAASAAISSSIWSESSCLVMPKSRNATRPSAISR